MTVIDDYKNVLASWASGVSVVATRAGELVYGITVSSFASLSLDPPLILVCVASRNRLPPMIRESGRFAVSLLSADQGAASSSFARSGREPGPSFADVAEERTAAGMPVVAGAMAFLCCTLYSEMVVGDHTIVVGQVAECSVRADRAPLLYYRRKYHTLDAR